MKKSKIKMSSLSDRSGLLGLRIVPRFNQIATAQESDGEGGTVPILYGLDQRGRVWETTGAAQRWTPVSTNVDLAVTEQVLANEIRFQKLGGDDE